MQDRLRTVRSGKEISPGITAIATPGHTPGHLSLSIASGREQLIQAGDVFHHPAFDLEHPHWATAFDADRTLAFETRRKLLDQASAEQTLLTAYHIPGGGVGRVTRSGDSYLWQQVSKS